MSVNNTNGRDKNGRFQPGHSVRSPGRPPRQTEQDYLEMLTRAVTPAKWQQIVNRAVTDAIEGDSRAREWMADYLIGKPPQTLEISAVDAALLSEVIRQLGTHGLTINAVCEAMLHELASAQDTDSTEPDVIDIHPVNYHVHSSAS